MCNMSSGFDMKLELQRLPDYWKWGFQWLTSIVRLFAIVELSMHVGDLLLTDPQSCCLYA